MKYVTTLFVALSTLFVATALDAAEEKLGFVNISDCFEQSNFIKDQSASFEAMGNQIGESIEKKQAELDELNAKLNDPDYRDSLSPDAEEEKMGQQAALEQQLSQQKMFVYQMMQERQSQLMYQAQKRIEQAATEVAQEKKYAVVFNSAACFYYAPSADLTKSVIDKMNQQYEQEKKQLEKDLSEESTAGQRAE